MSQGSWDEIRTAYQVARLGTVSGAADVLGVHHATVIRHIDALEGQLGTKLFQRHARGYTPTEAGRDLLQVAQTTDEQFSQLAGRLKGRGEHVEGELVITTLAGFAPMLAPVLARLQLDNPDLTIRYLTDDRVFRLEYGEAHVAIRAGSAPSEPDNVVQKFFTERFTLFASHEYLDKNGMPDLTGDLNGHRFIGPEDNIRRAPFFRWIDEAVPEATLVFRTSDMRAMKYAMLGGVGIGFCSMWEGRQHPELEQICLPREEWQVQMWLVTHVDLHRTAKVQAALNHLKTEARRWTQLRQEDETRQGIHSSSEG
ncbi:LysR family transcriptional regulator [Qingshengfaniella alkalisoli]|uniref:LysR family transcriptional regulator n=1 Tax=Qingshengfaniella alkalisoli TaxID=2599296 RepID=A0A5B8IXY0_9RHOB|nr:LysR family transcriptional regulator [Qingshengfaniella alkalisoli]QDY69741.1 LysR family transcriptional regulator [Qingshengfaniella alkalisoli]